MPEPALSIRSTHPLDGGLSAVVCVSAPEHLRTSAVPGIAEELLVLMPGLKRHPCESGSAHGIVAELADTETPHLAEHIALELLALAGLPRRELRGRTSWDFARDGAGVFRIAIAGVSPAAAAVALAQAVRITSAFLGESGEHPTAEDIVHAEDRVRAALG